MNIRVKVPLLCLVLLFSAMTLASEPLEGPVKFCGDGGGWPPYTFKKGDKVVGYDIDVLNAILKPKNIEFSVAMPSWKRCVEGTKIGLFDAAVSATYSEERSQSFILTDEYYSLTPVYVYSQKLFPNGLEISNAKDLENYHLCGVHGFNYDGIGVNSSSIDRTATSFDQLVKKTIAGRCAVFLTDYEIMIGFKIEQGIDYLAQGVLITKSIPDAPKDKNYMLISKNYKNAQQLKAILNEGFAKLRANGQLKKILESYE
ncbi:transporter substrate-binding domain-containing protein [Vibrio sp. S4M6]|uniref:substrate-binding periplasmic protein n=1 Tax=Vibrio sinus TaxID=2946865 RepID=UPI00202A8203|nr:transporter substrate-binding domain-containing protein [Vibrio sinus]MCL9781187.1 transporter substrate-binding domain-containing protein [Vibrio sinus]